MARISTIKTLKNNSIILSKANDLLFQKIERAPEMIFKTIIKFINL